MDTGSPTALERQSGGVRGQARSSAVSGWVRTGGRASVAAACLVAALAVAAAAAPKKKGPPPRTVSGKVLDENDNGIAGAAVELTDLQNGKKLDIFSEADGRYIFSDLVRTHDYEVRATYQGVSSDTRKASVLLEPQLILNLRIPPPQNP
ncbi:MAG TPA: carboxypeptidase-like regulatory domain-containing protein [Terriglobia bacterium]|nr:carboxypeptidase-like regulatory domain-containing protein [Terriglobia bacterium]